MFSPAMTSNLLAIITQRLTKYIIKSINTTGMAALYCLARAAARAYAGSNTLMKNQRLVCFLLLQTNILSGSAVWQAGFGPSMQDSKYCFIAGDVSTSQKHKVEGILNTGKRENRGARAHITQNKEHTPMTVGRDEEDWEMKTLNTQHVIRQREDR